MLAGGIKCDQILQNIATLAQCQKSKAIFWAISIYGTVLKNFGKNLKIISKFHSRK